MASMSHVAVSKAERGDPMLPNSIAAIRRALGMDPVPAPSFREWLETGDAWGYREPVAPGALLLAVPE
jgi:hypothetical protein